MAIFASTTLGTSDPSKAMSIKALEARANALAAAQAQQQAPQSMPSPWQGAGYLANTIADAVATKRADQAAGQRRQDLANVMSGIGAEGPTSQQLGQIAGADPELGRTYAQQAFQAREAAASRAEQEKMLELKGKQDEAYAAAQEGRLQARPSELEKTAGRPLTPEEQTAYVKKQTSPPVAEQKALDEQRSQNIDLQSAVDQLNEAHGLLGQGIRPGGLVGEATQGISKALPSVAGMVGVDQELTKRTDRFNQIMAGEALKVVNSMKGASSDKDLQFAIKTINDPSTSPENKAQQLRVLLAKANAHLQASTQSIESMGGKPVKVEGSTAGGPAAAVDPLEGKTATGPDGKKIVRRNGKWEPM